MDRLHHGDAVIEFAQAPMGFDPLKADLSKYGFSPRPRNAAKLAQWEQLARLKRVAPEFTPRPPGLRRLAPAAKRDVAGWTSPTWSGAVVQPPPGAGLAGVWGRILPPTTVGAPNNGRWSALLFAGIGGLPNSCLFQAGVYFEVNMVNGERHAQ